MTHTLFWIAECRQNWHQGFQSLYIGLIGCWNLSDVDLYDNKKNVISTVEIKLLSETLSSPRPQILLSSFPYFYMINMIEWLLYSLFFTLKNDIWQTTFQWLLSVYPSHATNIASPKGRA